MIDPNIFFRQVSLELCSSLDVNTALQRCLFYLRKHFPVDALIFGIHDTKEGINTHITEVSATDSAVENQVVILPPDIAKLFADSFSDTGFCTDHLVQDTQLNPITRAAGRYVKNQGCSEIILQLNLSGVEVGYMVMRAKGLGVYNHQHLELMQSVREPLAIAMANALSHQEMIELKNRLADDNRQLQRELSNSAETTIIGRDRGLRDIMEMVHQVAPLNTTVLLFGETGVGKEVIANAIQRLSPRLDGPFIKVNCGAIPENLVDSELFGHERGAFSGAVAQKQGRFERAHGGTIFLDEIGELPLAAQVRLLRVLQSHEIERVGGTRHIPINIRVIAATHCNLEKMVAEGEFREDLWFRLNAFPITIPPLRQRREDLPELLQYLIGKKSRELGYRVPPGIAPGMQEALISYPWPGNVRELENVVERALIQSRGRELSLEALTFPQQTMGSLPILDDAGSGPINNSLQPAMSFSDENPPLTLDELVACHIRQVLQATGGKIHGSGGAAELLGVNPSTLRNRMNKLGISYGRKAAN